MAQQRMEFARETRELRLHVETSEATSVQAVMRCVTRHEARDTRHETRGRDRDRDETAACSPLTAQRGPGTAYPA